MSGHDPSGCLAPIVEVFDELGLNWTVGPATVRS